MSTRKKIPSRSFHTERVEGDYPGVLIKFFNGPDIALVEHLPEGKFAVRVWDIHDNYSQNDPVYSQVFDYEQEGEYDAER